MTGPEHYREAEGQLKEQSRCRVTDEDGRPCPICAATLARAQVHATLALAAATADAARLAESRPAWAAVHP